jgi:hypothetical protein
MFVIQIFTQARAVEERQSDCARETYVNKRGPELRRESMDQSVTAYLVNTSSDCSFSVFMLCDFLICSGIVSLPASNREKRKMKKRKKVDSGKGLMRTLAFVS